MNSYELAYQHASDNVIDMAGNPYEPRTFRWYRYNRYWTMYVNARIRKLSECQLEQEYREYDRRRDPAESAQLRMF